MSVYVDDLADYGWSKGESCHMWADSMAALMALALKIGLRPQWLDHRREDFPHFDLVARKRELALKHGAVYKPLKEHIAERNRKRGEQ